MYVKGNPVLSKMYAHSGLILNETGLYYRDKDNSALEFLITADHVKIVEIMGMDYVAFEAAKELPEFLDVLMTSQYFRPSRFKIDTTDGSCRMLAEMAVLVNARNEFKSYTTRQIEDMFEPLKEFEFEQKYKELQLLKKTVQTKFAGSSVLKYYPEFDKTKFPLLFEKFNNTFTTQYERLKWFSQHTEKEIVEEFIKLG